MRGKVRDIDFMRIQAGITPALAGKSTCTVTFAVFGLDYPRACGEKCLDSMEYAIYPGSPPRMRGKVFQVHPISSILRITPALAGKSCCGKGRGQTYWDHPRPCGEKAMCIRSRHSSPGSSPRMRGKDQSRIGVEGQARITPALAGKSKAQRMQAIRTGDHPRACGEK